MGRVYQQFQWMAKEFEESLFHCSLLDNIRDPIGDHVLPVHPHPGAAQGQGQGQQESKEVRDGRTPTGNFIPESININLQGTRTDTEVFR